MTLHFVRPSLRRLIWMTIAVAVLACVVTGIALSIGFITGHNDNGTVPVGEYVRLAITSLTIWGPMYLLIAWEISIPVIITLGVLGACVRRQSAVTAPDESL